MGFLSKLVNAVEKRPHLWFAARDADWKDVADEVFSDEYYDWIVEEIEEKATLCREEWEILRCQYLGYIDFVDRSIYTKQKYYHDGYDTFPIALDFLGVPSNRGARLNKAMACGTPIRSSNYGYQISSPDEYTQEEKWMIEEFLWRRNLPSPQSRNPAEYEGAWQDFLRNGRPPVDHDPDDEKKESQKDSEERPKVRRRLFA
ncbi:uncharacterized protein LOC123317069 [Coccinella septempunctata]|uniref:uncharacterized protein LOC123317069 n=1 Tax=Coccinella septempunctata TaxID=41139 RepID=UPI001D064DC9|nr:uncharacterized protein LOC123317069 [Coccinella septempunctata]